MSLAALCTQRYAAPPWTLKIPLVTLFPTGSDLRGSTLYFCLVFSHACLVHVVPGLFPHSGNKVLCTIYQAPLTPRVRSHLHSLYAVTVGLWNAFQAQASVDGPEASDLSNSFPNPVETFPTGSGPPGCSQYASRLPPGECGLIAILALARGQRCAVTTVLSSLHCYTKWALVAFEGFSRERVWVDLNRPRKLSVFPP